MKVIKQLKDWYGLRETFKHEGFKMGFVPTMGHLHDGHLSLINRSVGDNDKTIVSIFVNPSQFNSPKDFANYPKTLDIDMALCEEAGVDVLLLPTADEIYKDQYRFQMSEMAQSDVMEGAYRPGHFTGVLTVVLKLLLLTQANNLYMGEKDYQQYELIRDMVKALFIDCKVIPCQTVRDKDGLALSSRNSRLAEADKQLAKKMNQILRQSTNCKEADLQLKGQGFKVDYVQDYEGRRYVAASIDGVRLIDNIKLTTHKEVI